MTLFSEAAEVLTSSVTETKSVTGSYARFGGGDPIAIRCWEGRTESLGSTGTTDNNDDHVDWIFEKSALLIDSVQHRPARGDRLTVAGVIYEVLPIREGDPAYELSGIERSWYRVHTKIRR